MAIAHKGAPVGDLTRQGVQALGLELFADEPYASNTVTAIKMPEDIKWSALSNLLREEHQLVLAGGQGMLSGKLFRIGHLGWVSESDINHALAAIEKALASLRNDITLAPESP